MTDDRPVTEDASSNRTGSPNTEPVGVALHGRRAPTRPRVPRRIWVGVVAVAVYMLLAAGLGNLMDVVAPNVDQVTELALSHLIPLPIAIAAGMVFAWRAGWWQDVWTDPPLRAQQPRRWWWFAVPAVIAAQVLVLLIKTPWTVLSASYILVGLVCYLLVGLGEEFYLRGILLEATRAHHGETVTLLVTAVGFGLAHSLGAIIAGIPFGGIAFEVVVTGMEGVLFYGALRVTGTLWAPILLHGLGDWGRWLVSGDGIDRAGSADITIQIIMTALAVGVLISVIREDLRARKARRPGNQTVTRPR